MSTNGVIVAIRSLVQPESALVAMAEVDELLEALGLLQLEIEQRVRQVDATNEAKAAGYSSTSAWLRADGRMHKSAADGLRANGRQFARLPDTVTALRAGEISHGMAAAIGNTVKPLPDDDAAELEATLLQATRTDGVRVEDITRLGKYKRALLDQDAALKDDEKAHQRRFLSVHVDQDGGMHGQFYLPPEPAARMQAALDKYAAPTTAGDTRTRCQRNADALDQLLQGQVHTELLVVVNTEPQNPPGVLTPTGHPLPAAHLERLATTSTLYRMVVGAKSKVLDLSHGVRLVPGWMRRAILALYPTCAYDNCPIEAQHCQTDHVHDWATHHHTKPDDIAPACAHHNRDRAKHPDKYQITKRKDGRWHVQKRPLPPTQHVPAGCLTRLTTSRRASVRGARRWRICFGTVTR